MDGGTGIEFSTAACGEAPAQPVTRIACNDFTECGGSGNITTTYKCDKCPRQAAFSVCEATECRSMDRTGIIKAHIEAPVTAVGARSLIVTTYNPVASDGTRLTCAGLLSERCDHRGDANLNPVNSNLLEVSEGINDRTPNHYLPISADVGSDRLVVVQITRASNGSGRLEAIGCAEGLEVVSNETHEITVDLEVR